MLSLRQSPIHHLELRVSETTQNFFSHKTDLVRGDLEQLFRQGQASLLIGLSFVAVSGIATDAIGQFGTISGFTITHESLTIVGWVAMCRPLRVLVYDGWPLVRRIRVYKALKHAQVRWFRTS